MDDPLSGGGLVLSLHPTGLVAVVGGRSGGEKDVIQTVFSWRFATLASSIGALGDRSNRGNLDRNDHRRLGAVAQLSPFRAPPHD